MKPTHTKISYPAYCIQWDGKYGSKSTKTIIKMFPGSEIHNSGGLMVRHQDNGIRTMYPRDWVVQKQNGEVKFYTDYEFPKSYKPVEERLPVLA